MLFGRTFVWERHRKWPKLVSLLKNLTVGFLRGPGCGIRWLFCMRNFGEVGSWRGFWIWSDFWVFCDELLEFWQRKDLKRTGNFVKKLSSNLCQRKNLRNWIDGSLALRKAKKASGVCQKLRNLIFTDTLVPVPIRNL